MKDLLRELFLGELYPAEELALESNEEWEKQCAYGERMERFKGQLSEAQLKEFEELEQLSLGFENEYNILAFKKGFQLGMQFALQGLGLPPGEGEQDE